MKWRYGQRVRHLTKGWRGYVVGAGFGREPSRWDSPDVIYVDWLHRKPGSSAEQPDKLKPLWPPTPSVSEKG